MYTAFSPCMARHRRTLRLRVETSVEAYWPPLTPEHGFPSLCFWPGHRALPLCPLPENRGAAGILPYTSFLQRSGKRQGRGGPRRCYIAMSLRWHYPHQVKGSERSLPLSPRAPLFSTEYYCIFAKDCQEGLQRPGKERMIFSLKKRGVRWRGLRGGRKVSTLNLIWIMPTEGNSVLCAAGCPTSGVCGFFVFWRSEL